MKQRRAVASPEGDTGGLQELRVTVPRALADLAAEFLVRAGAGGVVEEPAGSRVRLVVYGEEAALVELGLAAERAFERRARVSRRPLAPSLAGWETAWMEGLEPVHVSKTLVLAPTTAEGVVGSARAPVVRLSPAVAFGFGEHPTTRLAARTIERLCRRGAVDAVLDFGTGTGVLAIVAAVLGARRTVGLDVDPRAIAAARQNAALNGVASRCRFRTASRPSGTERASLVVANVDRGTILAHRETLAHAVAPGGSLLLTGFLREDVPDVAGAFSALGLVRGRTSYEGEWALVTFAAPAVRARRGPRATARRTTRTPRSR